MKIQRDQCKKNPLISVIIPVFNAHDTLKTAVQSILKQTFTAFELILIDDGADRATKEILHSFKDERIRVLTQAHAGIVAALNRGIAAAKGQFIARMDADDISLSQRFDKQIRLLKSDESLTATGCGVEIFSTGNITEGMQYYVNWLNSLNTPQEIRNNMFIEMPILHPTLMLRRETLIQTGGYRKGDFPEDYDLLLRLFAAGGNFAKVPETLFRWREHGEKLSRISPIYRPQAFRERKLACIEKIILQKNDNFLFWGVGRDGKTHARSLASRGWLPQAFVDISPKKIGQQYLGRPVIAPEQIPPATQLMLCCVGTKGARTEIQRYLLKRQFEEGRHFWFLA